MGKSFIVLFAIVAAVITVTLSSGPDTSGANGGSQTNATVANGGSQTNGTVANGGSQTNGTGNTLNILKNIYFANGGSQTNGTGANGGSQTNGTVANGGSQTNGTGNTLNILKKYILDNLSFAYILSGSSTVVKASAFLIVFASIASTIF
ncbi:unnamed protein product [Lymnaea stagnalis]|uniref:Uncharacterized protein n=1 Tax=Lymnaea stagnalis TaxID=6523 RepID=A0AAV2IAN0_LYMST